MVTSIGIVGTAKNTGKTTTISALLSAYADSGVRIGLTSIGYDGEEVDNITGLPKPRITANPGNLIATAESCFESSEAELRVIEKTDIRTSLGVIIIGEVVGKGLTVLAGPNKGSDVKRIIKRLENYGSRLVFVDGALNRIVPLMETDGIIIATGASRSTSVDYLEGEVSAILKLFDLSNNGISRNVLKNPDNKHILISSGNGNARSLGFSSLIREEHVDSVVSRIDASVDWVGIPGLCPTERLKSFVEKSRGIVWGKKILLRNPSQLVLSDDTAETADYVSTLKETGIEIIFENTLPIIAITVNPFYPVYQAAGSEGIYTAGLIDGEKLLSQIRAVTDIPVIDIIKDGPAKCMKAINERLK